MQNYASAHCGVGPQRTPTRRVGTTIASNRMRRAGVTLLLRDCSSTVELSGRKLDAGL